MTNKKKRKRPKKTSAKNKLITCLWYPILLLYLEICLCIWCFHSLSSLPYIIVTSLSLGWITYAITNLSHKKLRTNYIISIIVTTVISLIYISEVVYFKIFGTFFTLTSLTMAGDAAQYSDILYKVLFSNLPIVILMLIPLVVTILYKLRFTTNFISVARMGFGCVGLCVYLLLHLLLTTSILIDDSDAEVYNSTFLPSHSYETFGAALSFHCDIKQLLGFNKSTALSDLENVGATASPLYLNTDGSLKPVDELDALTNNTVVENVDYNPHVLDVDFATLAKTETDETLLSLHKYFANAPTQTENKYTGMFEGYNLIFLTAESFSHYAIDKDLTPTLYRLYNEGFQFTNFYTPGWSVSTTDGEYVALTGLIPKSGVRSFTISAENYMPFTMGMQTTAAGYAPIMAYHNHTYDYYSRDLSHPNMGYDYKALGHGLEVRKTWPESDLEMMELSVDDYINSNEPFHAYYMTVSGHQLYNFTGNYIAYQNKSYTDHLDYSEPVRAYLAANVELDLALEYLIDALETAGKLDKTLFVLSADHYPYGLTLDELEEINGSPVDDDFGKYKNAFLIWSASMEEPIVVDKPAQSLDIIPTISNLLGFDYDSRLLMGNDILGDDYDPMVIFSNRSFITEEGTYNTRTKEFTENEGISEVSDDYISAHRKLINAKFEVSELILDTDYYRHILE